jgi:hypothetical protein
MGLQNSTLTSNPMAAGKVHTLELLCNIYEVNPDDRRSRVGEIQIHMRGEAKGL